jgi:hypothetical protein
MEQQFLLVALAILGSAQIAKTGAVRPRQLKP